MVSSVIFDKLSPVNDFETCVCLHALYEHVLSYRDCCFCTCMYFTSPGHALYLVD